MGIQSANCNIGLVPGTVGRHRTVVTIYHKDRVLQKRQRVFVLIVMLSVLLSSVLLVFQRWGKRSPISGGPPPHSPSAIVRGKLSDNHGGIVQNGEVILSSP